MVIKLQIANYSTFPSDTKDVEIPKDIQFDGTLTHVPVSATYAAEKSVEYYKKDTHLQEKENKFLKNLIDIKYKYNISYVDKMQLQNIINFLHNKNTQLSKFKTKNRSKYVEHMARIVKKLNLILQY